MERLVLRTEYDPYMKMKKYLALYPDLTANPGRIVSQPFYFNGDGLITAESVCEIDYGYYICKTKRVRAKSEEAKRCKAALEEYYNRNLTPDESAASFRLVEKITNR